MRKLLLVACLGALGTMSACEIQTTTVTGPSTTTLSPTTGGGNVTPTSSPSPSPTPTHSASPSPSPSPTLSPSPSPSPSPTPTNSASPGGTYGTGVQFRGLNRSGLEYGDDWDGWNGQSYFDTPSVSQTTNELAYYKSKGMNIIRLPISWERIQHALNGSLDSTYSGYVMAYINAATADGFYVILDLHNYNRYAEGAFSGSTVTTTYTQRTMGDGTLAITHLANVWTKLTGLVVSNPKVILNIMNEPHDFSMTSTVWFAGVQTVMNAIRAAGSTQLILVPNSRGSDVDHWSSYAPNGGPLDSVAALAITDSASNYAFDMHSYQDTPTSATSYSDQVSVVTQWAKTNHKRLFLSEMGSVSGTADGAIGVGGLLSYMNTNNDVWLGWTAWNLPSYSITADTYTADAASMAWFTPYLTASFLGL